MSYSFNGFHDHSPSFIWVPEKPGFWEKIFQEFYSSCCLQASWRKKAVVFWAQYSSTSLQEYLVKYLQPTIHLENTSLFPASKLSADTLENHSEKHIWRKQISPSDCRRTGHLHHFFLLEVSLQGWGLFGFLRWGGMHVADHVNHMLPNRFT